MRFKNRIADVENKQDTTHTCYLDISYVGVTQVRKFNIIYNYLNHDSLELAYYQNITSVGIGVQYPTPAN